MVIAKRIFYVVLLLIVVVVIAIGGFWYFSPTVVDGPQSLQRSTSTQVMWGQQVLPVTTMIDLATFATCPQESAPLDVVILIDASGSMGDMGSGEPLGNAIRGAQAFVSSMDLTTHQVALGLFSESVFSQSGLTSDMAMIESTLADLDGREGGTNLSPPMSFAEAELKSRRRRADALPIVLLFSDGGAGDANSAITTANAIKRLGGQIFVVGLRGEGFDESVLRALATSEDTLRVAPTTTELTGLFEEIAQVVNSYVLQNVSYSEPIAYNSFELIGSSVSAPIQTGPAGLRFEADAMTQRDAMSFTGFSYQVQPTSYGLMDVTSEPGILSLEACGGPLAKSELPVGPRLLVLPPLPIVGLIPLVLLLLAAIPLLFSGRKVDAGGSTPIPPPPPPPPPPPQDNAFLSWLNQAENLELDDGGTNGNWINSPTLIIGLGKAGQTVLHQVSERIEERVGENWPNNVGLLHIALPRIEGEADPRFSLSDRVAQVVFTRDIDRQIQDKPYMDWAKGNSGSHRVRGRMSLFTDLSNGKGNSELWRALAKSIEGKKQIRVWIVTDGFGPASGMIADLAHLVRVVPNAPHIIESVRLCVVMQNANWGTTTGTGERCYATLREVQRMQLSDNTPFVYTSLENQQELRATHQGKMYDEIYLLDGIGESPGETPYDVSKLPPEKGVLKVISNAMVGLLDSRLATEFFNREKNTQGTVSRGGGGDLENYGSVMGCAVYRAPVGSTRRLVELRLLHHLLFDPVEGLWGWGNVDEHGHQTAVSHLNVPFRQKDVATFLNEIGGAGQARLTGIDFQQRLHVFLMSHMNKEKKLGLRWADKFLTQLASQGISDPSVRLYHDQIAHWMELVGTSVSESGNLQNDTVGMDMESGGIDNPLFKASFDDPAPRTAVEGRNSRIIDADPLIQAWAERWQTEYDRFPTTGVDEPEQLAWTIDAVPEIYKKQIKDLSNAVDRMRQRVFWYWSYHTGPALHLLVLPHDLSATNARGSLIREDIRQRPLEYAVGFENAEQLLQSLLPVVSPFSSSVNEEAKQIVAKLTEPSVQQRLNHNASPMFKLLERGGETVASSHERYLLKPPGLTDGLNLIKEQVLITGSDPTACVLLHVQHVVRFGTMFAYTQARQSYSPDPSLFVFTAEQEAAKRERVAKRWGQRGQSLTLSASAVAALDAHPDLMNDLGKLFSNGSLDLNGANHDWRVRSDRVELSLLSDVTADALIAEAIQLCEKNPVLLSNISTIAKEPHTSYQVINRIEEYLDALASSHRSGLRDLAVLIAWALDRA